MTQNILMALVASAGLLFANTAHAATLADGQLALPPFRSGIMVKVGPPRQRAKEA